MNTVNFTKEDIVKQWACVRMHNYTIPSEVLDNMRAVLEAALHPQPTDIRGAIQTLQSDIMNIPAKVADSEFGLDHKARLLYKEGHRDARHAAVELVMEFAGRIGEETK